MASFILLNRVVVTSGIALRPGRLVDDSVDDSVSILASGGQLAALPNPPLEALAAFVREQQARGRIDAELLPLFAAFSASEEAGDVPASRTLTAGAGLIGGGDLSVNRTFDVVGNADGSIIANANDVQVGVLATDGQHGSRGGGAQHSLVVPAGAAGFMSGADKILLDGLSAGSVPATRTLTAGAGLTGGGNLSTDRTFDAVAHVDGSIVVNVNDIQVGVLATDAQHGARGGGTQHAAAVAAGAAGFLTGSDKSKLDGVASGAAAVTASAPVNVTKAAAAVGVATDAARADHKHDITTAAAGTIAPDDAADEGVATSVARSDHRHAIAAATAGSIAVGDAAAEGASTSFARADHTHALAVPAAPADVTKAAASAGAATTVARSDHKHDVSTATAGTIAVGDAAAEGAATSLSRSDHVHALTVPAAPANVTKAAASAGAATTVARSDHKHDVTTAAAGTIAIGDAAAEGAATSLSRSDHTHALTAPAAPADVTKAAASAGAATTVARSDHKHDVSTAAPSDIGSANAEGAATSLARSNHVHNLTSAVAKAATTSGFTAGSIPFVIAGPSLSEDNAALFWNATNDQLSVGTNTFTNVREKIRMAKPAGDAYARFDGAIAAGVTDSSGSANLLSASQFLSFVVGSQLDADQFGFGNAGLYACARAGTAGVPPTLAPFTGLSCSDNAALVTLGDIGGGRSVYVGGGGWGAPAANDFSVHTAPTYTETVDTDLPRMHINAFGTVNHMYAMRETGIISPSSIGGGTTNNYNPTNLQQCRTIRQSVTAAHVLTGLTAPSLAGQVDGRLVRIINIATNVLFTLTLNHQDAGSTAANRFILPTAAALVIPIGGCVELMYDDTSARWRPVSTL